MVKPRLAFILAGGKSTRLGDVGTVIPKPLLPIHEAEPILFHNLKLCERLGCTEIVVLLGYKHKAIEHYLQLYQKSNPSPYIYPFVESEPLGTFGFHKKFDLKNCPFILINGDNLYTINEQKFIEAAQSNPGVTIACTQLDDATGFGLLEVKGNKITSFKEKPKTKVAGLVSSGIYYFNTEIKPPKTKDKIVMVETAVFPKLAEEGKLFAYKKCMFYPTDTLDRWQKANAEFKRNEPLQGM